MRGEVESLVLVHLVVIQNPEGLRPVSDRNLAERVFVERFVARETEIVEILVGHQHAVMALDTSRLALEEFHSPDCLFAHGGLVAVHVTIERNVLGIGIQSTLECGNGTGCVIPGRGFAKNLRHHLDVDRNLSHPGFRHLG